MYRKALEMRLRIPTSKNRPITIANQMFGSFFPIETSVKARQRGQKSSAQPYCLSLFPAGGSLNQFSLVINSAFPEGLQYLWFIFMIVTLLSIPKE